MTVRRTILLVCVSGVCLLVGAVAYVFGALDDWR